MPIDFGTFDVADFADPSTQITLGTAAVADSVHTGTTTVRSSGAYSVSPFQIEPTMNRTHLINGWSIEADAALVLSAITNTPPWARLGKLFAGVLAGPSSFTKQSSQKPFSPPLSSALVSIQQLWDGESDSAWPLAVATTPPSAYPTEPLIESVQLAQPLEIGPYDGLGVALWLSPSLIAGELSLIVQTASFAIDWQHA